MAANPALTIVEGSKACLANADDDRIESAGQGCHCRVRRPCTRATPFRFAPLELRTNAVTRCTAFTAFPKKAWPLRDCALSVRDPNEERARFELSILCNNERTPAPGCPRPASADT
jgi:hypothetical protein